MWVSERAVNGVKYQYLLYHISPQQKFEPSFSKHEIRPHPSLGLSPPSPPLFLTGSEFFKLRTE